MTISLKYFEWLIAIVSSTMLFIGALLGIVFVCGPIFIYHADYAIDLAWEISRIWKSPRAIYKTISGDTYSKNVR